MPSTNSYTSMIQVTLTALIVDCGNEYPDLRHELDRDLQRLSSALKQHGTTFACDTMPTFRKHFDRCLSEERLIPSGLTEFGRQRRGSPVPRLLRGLVLRVFESDGSLRDQCDTRAVLWIRQILSVFQKLNVDCPDRFKRKAVRDYAAIDHGLPPPSSFWEARVEDHVPPNPSVSLTDRIDRYGNPTLFKVEAGYGTSEVEGALEVCQQVADILTAILGVFSPSQSTFRHGPGVVSDLRRDEYKYSFPFWPDRLESVFPYAEFAFANLACWVDTVREGGGARSCEIPARLLCVPKTIRKPRLIAAEPASLQWCQQSIRSWMYSRCRHSIIGQFVDFTNQSVSGAMALKSSLDGCLGTIDLSDASDRVSCYVVERIFRRSPTLLRALMVSRSQYVQQTIDLKTDPYIRLRKYSSMGNATTFPIESLVFLVLSLGTVLYLRHQKPGLRSISTLKGQVRVFGDDIIVPSDSVRLLCGILETLFLKVNTTKTFGTGLFRESCGVDAFKGIDVTPVRILSIPSSDRPSSIVSAVDTHKNLCHRGLVCAAQAVRKAVEPRIANAIPSVEHGDSVFGWDSLEAPHIPLRSRWNESLHRREQLRLEPKAQEKLTQPKDQSGLLQYFTEAPLVCTQSLSTLGYRVRMPALKLRRRWGVVT